MVEAGLGRVVAAVTARVSSGWVVEVVRGSAEAATGSVAAAKGPEASGMEEEAVKALEETAMAADCRSGSCGVGGIKGGGIIGDGLVAVRIKGDGLVAVRSDGLEVVREPTARQRGRPARLAFCQSTSTPVTCPPMKRLTEPRDAGCCYY